MRSYSFFTIVLVCLGILLIDIIAFYWLQSITNLLDSQSLRSIINIAFWFFSVGLIAAIIILKGRLDSIHPRRKQLLVTSLYGLTVSSFIPKLVFVIIISVIYFTNHVFSDKESLIIIPLIGLFSGFLPFFIIIFGIFRTLFRFKVHHFKIKFNTLPKNFNGIRIVQISDLHLGSFNYRFHILDRAIEIINNLQPDLIVFTGDLVNNYAWELRGWSRVLRKLIAKKGKYAVLGNHDYGDYSIWETKAEKKENFDLIKDFYKQIDFQLLLNDYKLIQSEAQNIALIGVENWGSPPFKQYGNLEQPYNAVKDIPFKILLSHDPSHWSEEVAHKTDIALTFSGHTHGMQAGIRYKKMSWSPIKYKYKHWAGLYKNNGQYLYVNRGLGWLGFPGRLGMRPEITCIELES